MKGHTGVMRMDALLILASIVLNGALAPSEIAIVSSRRIRLTRMAETGNGGAARALALASDPTRFLSSVQVGITTIGILSGAIGEATIAAHVRDLLERVPAAITRSAGSPWPPWGRVPRTGDTFERGHHRSEIVDRDGNRIDRVLATRLEASARGQDDSSA